MVFRGYLRLSELLRAGRLIEHAKTLSALSKNIHRSRMDLFISQSLRPMVPGALLRLWRLALATTARPSDTALGIRRASSEVSDTASGVTTEPGKTLFTRMPLPANSNAALLTIAWAAALEDGLVVKSLVGYFVATFAVTWVSWGLAGAIGLARPQSLPLVYLGVFAPALVALALTARQSGRSGVRALLAGRANVAFEDLRKVYLPALRHRILLNFEAQAENISPDTILNDIVKEVSEKPPEA